MGSHLGGTPDRPALFFDAASDFDAWLGEHHASETALWMGLYKKHVASRGLTWGEAVPVALRWGWIDSTAQTLDADAVRQRWSPRKKGSTWSRVNIAHVERMIAEGTMQPSGLAAYALRTDENSAVYSYEMGETGLVPAHEARLRAVPAASAFWDAAPPSYRKIVCSWTPAPSRTRPASAGSPNSWTTARTGSPSPPSATARCRPGWPAPPRQPVRPSPRRPNPGRPGSKVRAEVTITSDPAWTPRFRSDAEAAPSWLTGAPGSLERTSSRRRTPAT
jgi:uncharacterized protein YdeI (YjbR/CyaY-like superfamily)